MIKNLRVLFSLSIPLFLGCSRSDELNDSSKIQAIDDISSSQQRSDGRFDVVSKDGSRDIVTSEQIITNTVCPKIPHTQPVGGYTVADASDSWIQEKSLVLGKDLEGEVSFVLNPPALNKSGLGEYYCQYNSNGVLPEITDGYGKKWVMENVSTQINFGRIKLPVTIKNPYQLYRGCFGYSKVKFFVAKSYAPKIHSNFITETQDGSRTEFVIGQDLTGAAVELDGKDLRYSNFAAGTDCFFTELLDSAGLRVSLADKTQHVKLRAPISVRSVSLCQSSRLPNPQNKTKDFDIFLSNFVIGTKL